MGLLELWRMGDGEEMPTFGLGATDIYADGENKYMASKPRRRSQSDYRRGVLYVSSLGVRNAVFFLCVSSIKVKSGSQGQVPSAESHLMF